VTVDALRMALRARLPGWAWGGRSPSRGSCGQPLITGRATQDDRLTEWVLVVAADGDWTLDRVRFEGGEARWTQEARGRWQGADPQLVAGAIAHEVQL